MLSHQNKLKNHWFRNLFYLVVALLWVVALPLVIVHRQDVVDWWRLQKYQPPILISSISKQDTMTDYAQKIFYVNMPAVTGKAKFNQACPSYAAEQTIVLGCYHSGQNGIYIYDVTDARLDGVEQVTAAHEMLHAAFERMTDKQKLAVGKQLQDFYDNGLQDERIKKTIDAYKDTEPKELVNEMHSIFGTEVRNLPSTLEEHYKQYFKDRPQVVGFAEKYQAEFTSRQEAVKNYDNQLSTIKSQIDNLEDDLKSKQEIIYSMQKNLISLRGANRIEEYNAGVPGYNNLVADYNNEVQQVKNLISQYNQMVVSRNAIALEENELVKDINSQAQTIKN